MTLGDKQRLFPILLGKLITFTYVSGYELTLGEAHRTDEQAEINALGSGGRSALVRVLRECKLWRMFTTLADAVNNNTGNGIRGSLHELRLAVDLNLFKDKVYLVDARQYKILGDFWKTLHPDCRWGGDFQKPDADHFSLTHEGKQ